MSTLILSTAIGCSGTPEHTALRVKRLGGQWIVENCIGVCVGEAGQREEAILLARTVSDTHQASLIAVLGENGEIEMVLDV
jgi:hypothetical protein